jgi:FkbM family methyltransferase
MTYSQKDIGFLNIALNRPATQSSVFQSWNAQGAVSGILTGKFGFYTAAENEPFWSVDLLSIFTLRRIVIYNREDGYSFRAVPLSVEVSLDGEIWTVLAMIDYVFGGAITGKPLDLFLKDGVKARYLRLRRIGLKEHFHLDQVEIFTGIKDLPSKAQIHQDSWVIQMCGGRRDGHFIEIGSTNGVDINNTYMLETAFGWRGACVEPNPTFYEKLAENRKVKTFNRAVFSENGKLMEFIPVGELGSLVEFANVDMFYGNRKKFLEDRKDVEQSGKIIVETISPTELLLQSDMPPMIEYLSLDTEGSEWEILKSFDLNIFKFGLISVEHNRVADKRKLIKDLLNSFGYIGMTAHFDDWYYHPDYLRILNGEIEVDFEEVCWSFIKDMKFTQGYHENFKI